VSRRPNPRLVLPVVLVVLVAAGIYWLVTSSRNGDGLTASGTVEAGEIHIAPEIGGRVQEVFVETGDAVAENDRLVLLDDALLQAQRERVVAAVATAEQALRAAEINQRAAGLQQEMVLLAARAQDLARSQGSWRGSAPAEVDLPAWYLTDDELLLAANGEVQNVEGAVLVALEGLRSLLDDPANADLRRAELRLALAQAAFLAADAVYERARVAHDPEDLLDLAQDERDQAEEERDAAQDGLDDLIEDDRFDPIRQARADLAGAEARQQAARAWRDSLLTGERSLEVSLGDLRLQQAQTAAAQARAALEQAQAELRALDVQLERTILRAPVAGVVLARSADPGEVLPVGAPALTIGKLDELTITVYLSEDSYGRVRLGDSVWIEVDSFPGEVFDGSVVRIADRAEFTPRNVQTEEGRRTTVFAVELAIDDPTARLKPGMPADVEFVSS
jgi:HlyD family secretion protein